MRRGGRLHVSAKGQMVGDSGPSAPLQRFTNTSGPRHIINRVVQRYRQETSQQVKVPHQQPWLAPAPFSAVPAPPPPRPAPPDPPGQHDPRARGDVERQPRAGPRALLRTASRTAAQQRQYKRRVQLLLGEAQRRGPRGARAQARQLGAQLDRPARGGRGGRGRAAVDEKRVPLGGGSV